MQATRIRVGSFVSPRLPPDERENDHAASPKSTNSDEKSPQRSHCGNSTKMADREGFEPSVTLLPHTLSKRAHSTTLTPALGGRDARNSIRPWQPLFDFFKNLRRRSTIDHPGEDP